MLLRRLPRPALPLYCCAPTSVPRCPPWLVFPFGQVGRVRYADVLREAGPGSRSKGCGIVEFEAPEEAAAAITDLHDTVLGGRQIFVR